VKRLNPLAETLSLVLEELEARGDHDLVAEIEHSIEALGPTKFLFKKIFRKSRKKKKKRWLCATKPMRKKTRRTKKIVWYSMVRYKEGSTVRQLFRIVGRNPKKRPKFVKMGGKRLKWCT
jgi:hypothetical protein